MRTAIINIKATAGSILAGTALAILLVGCGGGGGGGSSPGSGNTGTTLTLSGFSGVSTVSGLVYNSIVSNSGTSAPTNYLRIWTTSSNGIASLIYQVSSTEETLNFDVTADSSVAVPVWYYAATSPLTNTGFCHVSGTTNALSLPLCSALNIAVNRSAGTITFTSSPALSWTSTGTPASTTGTLSGSLTFPAF